MNKLIMLGTGHGFVHELQNTCFIINDKFLIDTGGSADIVKNIKLSGIKLSVIHDVFISHTHTDHLLGLFWLLKRLTGMYKEGTYTGNLNVYCNDEVADAITDIYKHLYPDVYVNFINEYMNIIIVNDGEELLINNQKYKFIDMKASKNKLFGFETIFDNGKTLVFLGDETLNKELYDAVKDRDYVMHEAFCLDADKEIFNPYGKKHSTVKYAILYKEEAKKYFDNNIIVPKDLDVIKII